MGRQDRIAQLFSLLEEAEQNNDSDKITEIKSDLFKEFGISKRMGGMMRMDQMTRPLKFEVGGPLDMTDKEIMSSEKAPVYVQMGGDGIASQLLLAVVEIVANDGKIPVELGEAPNKEGFKRWYVFIPNIKEIDMEKLRKEIDNYNRILIAA